MKPEPEMPDPAAIHPDQFEILATRTVRAAGAKIDHPRVLESVPADERSGDYVLRLGTTLRRSSVRVRLLIECRRGTGPVNAAALAEASERFPEHVVAVFSTAGYGPDAEAHAAALGFVLFRVTDARAGYGEWGFAGQVPAWLPEYGAEWAGGAAPTTLGGSGP